MDISAVNMRAVFGLLLALACWPAERAGGTDPPLAAERPLIAAHRGSMTAEPENTLPAIAWAKAIGADLAEIDLRASADGHIVVIHDKRLNRTTDGSGLVREHKLAELRALDAGRGYQVPTVEEALELAVARDIRLLLDLKDTNLDLALLLRAVRSRDARERVIFGVRTPKQLASIKGADPASRTLAFAATPLSVGRYLQGGVDAIRLWPSWLRGLPPLARSIRQAGVEVWVTAGRRDGDDLRSLIEMGVDGLITDHPQTALTYRK